MNLDLVLDNFTIHRRYDRDDVHTICLRFNASEFLEKLRGKRLVYVGDSISRNQWESMLCMLRRAVPEGGGSFRGTNGGRSVAYVIHVSPLP